MKATKADISTLLIQQQKHYKYFQPNEFEQHKDDFKYSRPNG